MGGGGIGLRIGEGRPLTSVYGCSQVSGEGAG